VFEGRVFVATEDGSLTSWDLESGQRLFQVGLGGVPTSAPSAAVLPLRAQDLFASDAQVQGQVPPDRAPTALFIGLAHGELLALDAATGAMLWHHTTGPLPTSPLVLLGFNPQPDPPSLRVLVADALGTVQTIFWNGVLDWRVQVSGPVSLAPVAYGGPNARGYGGPDSLVGIATSTGSLIGLDASDGQTQWTTDLRATPAALIAGDPEAAAPQLFVGLAANPPLLQAYEAADGSLDWSLQATAVPTGLIAAAHAAGGKATLFAAFADGSVKQYELDSRPTRLWTLSFPTAVTPAPTQAGEWIFLADTTGAFGAMRQGDGSVIPTPVGGVSYAFGVCVIDGMILAIADDEMELVVLH
jgi:outer membrane protein assembly factor BamB